MRGVPGEINLTTVGWISVAVATEGGAYKMKKMVGGSGSGGGDMDECRSTSDKSAGRSGGASGVVSIELSEAVVGA